MLNPNSFLEKKINKKILIAVLAVIILSALAYKFFFIETFESKEFIGSVKKIEGDYVYAFGVFTVIDHPEFYDPKERMNVRIEITPKTEIVKNLIHMPSRAELQASKGRWNPADLRTEFVAGSLEDIKNAQGMPVKITTSKNIFKKPEFTAQKIEYIEQVYPD